MSAIWAILLSGVVAVQNPQVGEPPKPLGKISGVVTRRDDKRPIANVTIRLVRWEGGLGQPIAPRATDADGRFVFDGLQPGSYGLTFSAERFVSLQYGQDTPQDTARRVELKDAQHFENAHISLPPTTAIEGRLLDEFGDPAPGIVVQPAIVQFAGGKRRLMPVVGGGSAPRPTDDQGRFRIINMAPGEYYLIALAGPFAGPDDPAGFAVTYFPGTSVPMEAQSVSLELGKDLTGLVFQLQPAAMGTVSGVVTDESGKPIPGSVMFLPTSGGDVRAVIMGRVAVGADGAFTFRNVPAGTYVIQAWGRPVGAGNLGAAPFGALPVTVAGGADLTGLAVKVSGTTARGRILFEGDAPLPPPSRVLVLPSQTDFAHGPIAGGPPNRVTREDWTFEVNNMNGLRVVRLNIGSLAWTLKRVTLNGRDITDEPIDFRKGDVDGIEITLTSRAPVLTGSVTDADRPAPACTVVVFAADATKWTFPSRFFAQVRPDPQGRFTITSLPPGDYLVLALPSVQGADWQDPEFLKQHAGAATHASLGEGGTQTISLKVYR